jgi:hypothetical protein
MRIRRKLAENLIRSNRLMEVGKLKTVEMGERKLQATRRDDERGRSDTRRFLLLLRLAFSA